MKDRLFLIWLHDRLHYKYGESVNADFMHKLRSIIEKIPASQDTPNKICSVTPEHHIRYARAWFLHQDPHLSVASKLLLEKEMDAAQNSFTFQEFQLFKLTLPGFTKLWEAMREHLIEQIEQKFGKLP